MIFRPLGLANIKPPPYVDIHLLMAEGKVEAKTAPSEKKEEDKKGGEAKQCLDPVTGESVSKNELKRRMKEREKEKRLAAKKETKKVRSPGHISVGCEEEGGGQEGRGTRSYRTSPR